MHNTLRLLQPIPLLQLTALLQAIQLVDILQPLMAGRAMATAQDHPTSCAKLSERARLVTVAPTLSPMPNGKPLSSASGTAESATTPSVRNMRRLVTLLTADLYQSSN